MPTYSFIDTETDEEFDMVLKISEREEFLSTNPHIKQIPAAPALVRGTSTNNKVPEGFKEVLSKVAEAHPTSVVGERYGKKSIREVRTREIVDKHYKRMKKG